MRVHTRDDARPLVRVQGEEVDELGVGRLHAETVGSILLDNKTHTLYLVQWAPIPPEWELKLLAFAPDTRALLNIYPAPPVLSPHAIISLDLW